MVVAAVDDDAVLLLLFLSFAGVVLVTVNVDFVVLLLTSFLLLML